MLIKPDKLWGRSLGWLTVSILPNFLDSLAEGAKFEYRSGRNETA